MDYEQIKLDAKPLFDVGRSPHKRWREWPMQIDCGSLFWLGFGPNLCAMRVGYLLTNTQPKPGTFGSVFARNAEEGQEHLVHMFFWDPAAVVLNSKQMSMVVRGGKDPDMWCLFVRVLERIG